MQGEKLSPVATTTAQNPVRFAMPSSGSPPPVRDGQMGHTYVDVTADGHARQVNGNIGGVDRVFHTYSRVEARGNCIQLNGDVSGGLVGEFWSSQFR